MNVIPAEPGKARKKRRNVENWSRNIAKRMRYSPSGFPSRRMCNHKSTKAFQCEEISLQDVRRFHQKFYAVPNRIAQHNFILRHVTVETAKRSRSREGNNESHRKKVTTKYFIPRLDRNDLTNVPVCKNMFVEALGISRDRVQNVTKKFMETGDAPLEARGGDKRSRVYTGRKQSVKSFIEKIPVLESHYCRGKNVHRQYISSDLSIKKLWDMYQSTHETDFQVKYDYFRNIFDSDYNIGFGSPATDCCSTCISLKGEIKLAKDMEKKNRLKATLTLHKLKADAFFNEVRKDIEDEITLSFDCQKNQIIPKIPDQSAYYLRQMYIFNFTICQGHSHSALTKENVFSYVWLESEFPKGSNQISSAVYHRLNTIDMTGIRTIKLIADGCGGQNKNSMLIGMLSKFLVTHAPPSVKIIKVVYPIVGHSFIPPDRVFGVIEKEVKKHDTLLSDKEYIEIFERHASVVRLGEECPVLDWKSAIFDTVKKPANWHFQMQPCKRLIIARSKNNPNRCVLRGEVNYNQNLGEGKSILKRGKKFQDLKPRIIEKGVLLKKEKLKDINTLLGKHFSINWTERNDLQFFKDLLQQQNALKQMEQRTENVDSDDCGDINEEDTEITI